MRILAISGSARAASRSTALLRALAAVAGQVRVMDDLAGLPIFSPDREGPPAPEPVEALLAAIAAADAVVICSPEYVHSFPGGLKNAIDWCVSRPEIIHKPVALLHASHRGDEMLGHLRRVLATVTDRFAADVFLRLPLASLPEGEVAVVLRGAKAQEALQAFALALASWVAEPPLAGQVAE